MDELLHIQELPGVSLPFTNSPLLLFKYDETGDGKITKEEFVKLVHFFQAESKKLQKRFEHAHSASNGSLEEREKEKEKEKLLGLFPRRTTLKRSQSRSDITTGVRTCIDANKGTSCIARLTLCVLALCACISVGSQQASRLSDRRCQMGSTCHATAPHRC